MRRRYLSLFISVVSAVGLSAEPYRIEAITFPEDVVPEVGGIGFTPEGEIAVALRRHGIMMAHPTTDPTGFAWRRFSTDSLHNPCGIDVISGQEVVVSQMQELTRISDTDGDGEADRYETISADWGVTGNYHETNAITRDGVGGWYLAIGTASHNGPTFHHTRGEFSEIGRTGRNFSAGPWKGWVVHVSPDGKTTPFAKGFRAHNGILLDDKNQMWATDNQGDWRGTSPLYLVQKDHFYGHPSSLVWDKNFVKEVSTNPLQYYIDNPDRYEADRTKSVVEFPQGIMCNSPSEPIVDNTAGSFGPFTGQLFVGDVAGSRILRVMVEEVDGVMQGACVLFVTEGLGGGNNRLAFSPDGTQLFVGQTLRGWGRNTAEGLKRITYTGEMPFEVKDISLQPEGFRLSFTKPVPCATLEELSNYNAQSYWYQSSHRYGSPQRNKTDLRVLEATPSEDGLSVDLKIAGIKRDRVIQLDLGTKLIAEDGAELGNSQLCYTVRKLRR